MGLRWGSLKQSAKPHAPGKRSPKMSNEYNKHLFTHNGVRIFAKDGPTKFHLYTKAFIGKDHKDYLLLKATSSKFQKAAECLKQYLTELGWKGPGFGEDEDTLTEEEELMSKKIEASSQMTAFNEAHAEMCAIWNNFHEGVKKAALDGVKIQDSIEAILLDNGFHKEHGMFTYKLSKTHGLMVSIFDKRNYGFPSLVQFIEAEYKQSTDKETNKTEWHWSYGSTKATIEFKYFFDNSVKASLEIDNSYACTGDAFKHVTNLLYVAEQCFIVFKSAEDKVQLHHLVSSISDHEIAD
jgi:hypothetical protein